MITTKITFVCDGRDGKSCDHTFIKEGENVTHRSVKLAAKAAGWTVRGKKAQFCADHKFVAAPKGERKAKSKKAAPQTVTKVSSKKAPSKKVNGSRSPFVGGTSTGRLAKTAKAAAAPAAE